MAHKGSHATKQKQVMTELKTMSIGKEMKQSFLAAVATNFIARALLEYLTP